MKTRIRSNDEFSDKITIALKIQKLILCNKAKDTDERNYAVLMSEIREYESTFLKRQI